MRIARLGNVGQEVPVVLTDTAIYDARSVVSDINAAFFASGGIDILRDAHATGCLPILPNAESLRIGAPIARPSAVICIGMNYAAHAAESGSTPPPVPILFLKTPNTIVGPNDNVHIPRGSTKTDWEVELGIVIGTQARYLDTPEDSLQHIAGFVATNDISERAFQLEESGGQWSKGKCSPGFNPTGPWLVTPEEVDHQNLSLRSWVNGQPRQDSTTADMIFPVEYIIWHLSQYLTLEPGDLILTGTPEGVALSGRYPYLTPGDKVEIQIDGLGQQEQRFVGDTL